MLKYKACPTLPQGGLDIRLKVGILAEIGCMLHKCAVSSFPCIILNKMLNIDDIKIQMLRAKTTIKLSRKNAVSNQSYACANFVFSIFIQINEL